MITMWAAVAGAAVLDVGAGHPHATLTDALASAADGDVIVLHDPVVGTFTVDGLRDLVIRGAPEVRWEVRPTANPNDRAGVQLLNGAQVRFVGIHFLLFGTTAISAPEGDVVVERSRFGGRGSGISVAGGSVAVSRTRFSSGCMAIEAGDGVPVDVTGSVFVGNQPFVDDCDWLPVIEARTSTVDITGSTFVQNGPVVDCETCTITDSAFVGNTNTGTFYLVLGRDAVLERNRFCGNSSNYTTVMMDESATLRNNAFVDNLSDIAVVMADDLTLEHNTFRDNTAPLGWVAVFHSLASMVGNLVVGNEAWPGNDAWPGGYSTISSDSLPFEPVTSEFYNAWYDNAPSDASFPLDATDLVGVDPLLGVGAACSWDRVRPRPRSPLIDGDPTLLDADGTPADIGATGGPAAP